MEKLTTVVHVKRYAVTDIVTSSSISVGTGMVVSGTTISCHYTLFAAPLSTNSGIQARLECVDFSHYVKNPRQRFDNLFSKVIKKDIFPCSSHFPSTKLVLQSACKARKSEGGFYLHSLALLQNRQSASWRRKSFRLHNYEILQKKRRYLLTRAQVELAGGLEVINDLGLDTLTFLATTVLIVPTFKAIKASPILGFFISGVVLNQLGWIRNITDVKALSELGILFLLFEMGLELSLARLKALAKFAFGLGLAQVLFSTLAFTAFELPPNGAIGTKILEFLFHSRPDLVNIRSIDEAVVIGAALSMSSSAFVLQLLAERGELPTRFGSATLGILLFQDIAVVPLLVILPILESGNLGKESLWPLLAAESLKALGGLGALSIGGQVLIRRIFEVVADSRSSEAFNALCLLTVTGTSLLTQKLGFSDTLGAFLAGALLAETNFRTQIEADIRPFRGLLLGLFFVTTGTSIDIQLLIREWPNVLTLLGGLIAIKTIIITALGPRVGLSLPESVRIGLLLSQGGEFAFVVFSLANRLGVLPLELNRLLIIVVVLSMSLTPFLNELGRKVAESIEAHYETPQEDMNSTKSYNVSEPVVIIGFGQMGQVLANFLTFPFAAGLGGEAVGWPFVAFDLDPGIVKAARKLGFPVLYGDGSRPLVLQTAGIRMPKAVMIMYTGRQKAVQAVERLRLAFPGIPIYARAQDLGHLLELKKAGASDAILENTETSLQLGSVLLRGLGVMSDDVSFLTRIMRESMELRAREALEKKDGKEDDLLMPFQVKVRQKWNAGSQKEANMKEFDKLPPLNSYKLKKREGASSVIGLAVEGVGLQALEGNMPNEVPSSSNEIPGRSSEGENPLSSSIEVVESTGINLQHLQQSGTEPSGTDMPAEFTVASHWPNEAGTISTTNSVNGPERESSRSSTLKKPKLVWHGNHCHSQVDALDQDNRGVTWCALTDDDDSFHEELEEGELIERIDESIEYVSNMDRP